MSRARIWAALVLGWAAANGLHAEPIREEPAAPAIKEPPTIPARPPAKSARPAQSAKPAAPAEPSGPDLNLRPAEPSLIVEPRPAAQPAPAPPAAPPAAAGGASLVLPGAAPESAGAERSPSPPAEFVLPTQHPEGTAMKPTTPFGLAAVLGAAILAAGDPPAARSEPAKDTVESQIEKLRTAIDSLSQIEKRLNDYESRASQDVRKLREELTQAKDQIRTLQSDVAAIRDLLKRADGYTARRVDAAAPAAGRGGHVRLTNDYVTEMSVLVNGVSHRLLPGQQTVVDVPAGAYTYQVLGVQAVPQNRVITSDDWKDIRIHPPLE